MVEKKENSSSLRRGEDYKLTVPEGSSREQLDDVLSYILQLGWKYEFLGYDLSPLTSAEATPQPVSMIEFTHQLTLYTHQLFPKNPVAASGLVTRVLNFLHNKRYVTNSEGKQVFRRGYGFLNSEVVRFFLSTTNEEMHRDGGAVGLGRAGLKAIQECLKSIFTYSEFPEKPVFAAEQIPTPRPLHLDEVAEELKRIGKQKIEVTLYIRALEKMTLVGRQHSPDQMPIVDSSHRLPTYMVKCFMLAKDLEDLKYLVQDEVNYYFHISLGDERVIVLREVMRTLCSAR